MGRGDRINGVYPLTQKMSSLKGERDG